MLINEVAKTAEQYGNPELQRIHYLDGWRGVAILLVLVSHFTLINGVNFGRMGVDVFFVLSGRTSIALWYFSLRYIRQQYLTTS